MIVEMYEVMNMQTLFHMQGDKISEEILPSLVRLESVLSNHSNFVLDSFYFVSTPDESLTSLGQNSA